MSSLSSLNCKLCETAVSTEKGEYKSGVVTELLVMLRFESLRGKYAFGEFFTLATVTGRGEG